jgi:predicted CopG family antitoxin
MNRKTITLDADIIDALNKKRLGGETWNDFFRRIIECVPERNDWERGVKND